MKVKRDNNNGKIGESAATDFLKRKGYAIIERNFRIRNGEIDIIAIDKKEKSLVFIEVKTRSSDTYGTPFEAIHYWKMKALLNAAQVYKLSRPTLPDLLRIDAVAVFLNKNSDITGIEHMKNVSS